MACWSGNEPRPTVLLPAAREAVQAMRRFNELFLTYDADAGKRPVAFPSVGAAKTA